jgi:uncharacterized membrane protein
MPNNGRTDMAQTAQIERGRWPELRAQIRKRRRNDAGAADPAARAEERLARSLGWFSIGLGVTELLMPRLLGRAIGVGEHPLLLRALGLREIASGVGILSRRVPPAAWMRSRVAGDVIDLTLLGLAAVGTRRTRRARVVAASAAVLGVTALDVISSNQLGRREGAALGAARIRKSIIINRPAEELYRFWRNLENLPRVMSHLEAVRCSDDRRSHWIAKGPGGSDVEWDAELGDEQPGERIAWRSLEGSQVQNEGAVEFEPLPAGRGTLVSVELQYKPPAGQLGIAIAKLLMEDPQAQIAEDLRRFKQLMETGEVARADGPHGRRSIVSRHLP